MDIKNNLLSSKILYVALEHITPYKYSPRTEINDAEIISISSSIRKNGLLFPLVVRKNIDDTNKYILVSGMRRYFALKFLKAERVPVMVLSLTETEAEIFNLCEEETKKPLSIFEKAAAMKRILKSSRITKEELADFLGISLFCLEQRLSVLELTEQQKSVIINHSFSDDFIFTFLKVEKEKREEILNYIIVNRLSNDESIKYITEYLTPKKEPIKTACLTNDIIIMNSIERLAENLNSSGISATTKKISMENHTEYTLIIEKKLKQLTLPL